MLEVCILSAFLIEHCSLIILIRWVWLSQKLLLVDFSAVMISLIFECFTLAGRTNDTAGLLIIVRFFRFLRVGTTVRSRALKGGRRANGITGGWAHSGVGVSLKPACETPIPASPHSGVRASLKPAY